MTNSIQLIEKVKPLFDPFRYKVLYGGRGGLKSWSIARVLILNSMMIHNYRVLCTREFQNSIKESVFKLLETQIEMLGFSKYFKITNNEITNKFGSSFIFTGLHNNVTKIKSMEGIDVAWVEEAETVSDESWAVLLPTVRKPGSEIWISFNPLNEDDPVYSRFITHQHPSSFVQRLSWFDNPWISPELLAEKEHLKRVDYDSYLWVWEGEFLKRSKAQVLADKVVVERVNPQKDWIGPFYGIDWGFSTDPTRMVKCWVFGNKLFIELEANGKGVDIDKLPQLLLSADFECNKYTMRGDNARPETISYLRQHGFPKLVACKKGKGSVNEGIAFIRTFEQIVIDPSCEHTIYESRMYKYKTNKVTGDITTELEDKFNHSWDAVRYALEPIIPSSSKGSVTVRK